MNINNNTLVINNNNTNNVNATNNISQYAHIITQLLNKYSSNKYILERIDYHINSLPNTLEIEFKNYNNRQDRNITLLNEQTIFIQIFLNSCNYYYLQNIDFYYEYNNKQYKYIKQDDVIHNIVSTISKCPKLLQWKYKTKTTIIKLIKERSLFNSIPDSETIQTVLNNIYPHIFKCKTQAKYFLTVLGDNILKKNQSLIFLISQKNKKLLIELDNISYFCIGVNNITHNFMTKYHENHSYENCRIIHINDSINIDSWKLILRNIGLNLLCLSTHYSNRYLNSDNYINTIDNESLKNQIYYLKNTTQPQIADKFIEDYIIIIENDDKINNPKMEWKHLHYLWKQFLIQNNLPNILYSTVLKSIIKTKYKLYYNNELDEFNGFTSKYLPIESTFIKFWNNAIIINAPLENEFIDNELEISELILLFKSWAKINEYGSINITDDNIIKILTHFFPDIDIIEEKYILNIQCILWDKNKDIKKSFTHIKNEIVNNNLINLISFNEIYNYYCKYCILNSLKFIVGKNYFEKYLCLNFEYCIVYETFIEIPALLQNII